MAKVDSPCMIVWEEANKILLSSQHPDTRQARKALFKRLLRKGHKTLNLQDVETGMKLELRHDLAGSFVPGIHPHEMTKTIKLAFMAACDLGPPGEQPRMHKRRCSKSFTSTALAARRSTLTLPGGISVSLENPAKRRPSKGLTTTFLEENNTKRRPSKGLTATFSEENFHKAQTTPSKGLTATFLDNRNSEHGRPHQKSEHVEEHTPSAGSTADIDKVVSDAIDKVVAKVDTIPVTAKVDTGMAHIVGKPHQHQDAKGKSVDKREFHAFLVALRCYLELAELFEICEGKNEDDQKLSLRNLMKGKDTLAEWGVTEEMVKEQFKGVDNWTSILDFSHFADFVMTVRMAAMHLHLDDSDDEEVQVCAASAIIRPAMHLVFEDAGEDSELNKHKVRETFNEWDADGSGGLEFEELAAVMKELNPAFTDAKCRLLFEAADENKDGVITFDEFLHLVFR